MSRSRLSPALFALLVPLTGLAAPTPAQSCAPIVTIRGNLCLGGTFEFCLEACPDCNVCVVASPTPGPILVGDLVFHVGFPVESFIKGRITPTGQPWCERFRMPNDPNLIGAVLYWHAFGDNGLLPHVLELGDFGSVTLCSQAGEIGDAVFCDLDGDGTRDAGEPGIGGVELVLRCTGGIERRTRTASDGGYLFAGVPPGDCRVEVVGTTLPLDKVLGPGCPSAWSFTLQPGQSIRNADFCLIGCSECHGQVGALTLRHDGSAAAHVVVTRASDGRVWFDGNVPPGGVFSFTGADAGEGPQLGELISIRVDGGPALRVDTSCSTRIGPGAVHGAFTVIGGRSRLGGALCRMPGC